MNAFTHAIQMMFSKPTEPADQTAASFLVFRLGSKKFGVDVAKVRELLRYDALTKIENHGEVIEDVAVWRNNVVPVVDMRLRFTYGMPVYEANTTVVMLELAGRFIGMTVDSVAAVVKLSSQQIHPLPADASAAPACLLGVSTYEGDNLILLDIDKLISVADVPASQKLS
jgi:purine-binding chemotaxis protein CheW